jgi:hypothetical protein
MGNESCYPMKNTLIITVSNRSGKTNRSELKNLLSGELPKAELKMIYDIFVLIHLFSVRHFF